MALPAKKRCEPQFWLHGCRGIASELDEGDQRLRGLLHWFRVLLLKWALVQHCGMCVVQWGGHKPTNPLSD
jgi:hypothetical protein